MQKDIDKIAAELANNLSPEQLREKWEQRQKESGIAPRMEIREAEKAYWEKVWSNAGKNVNFVPMRQHKPESLQYDEARRKFWSIMQFRAAAIETLSEQPFSWRFTDEEKAILQNLVRYFINDPQSEYLLHKGLFVYGLPGTGKTEIMLALQKFCESNELQKAFKFTSMSAVHIQAKTDKDFDPVTENVQYDRAFDEFGRNAGAVIRYGDSIDINEAIVELRYERWKRYGQLSHFIANATPNDVKQLFSSMVYDRIREMCTSVLFPGESKRK